MLLVAAIAALVAAGITLPSTPLPRLAIVTPMVYFVAMLCDVSTAVILLATWRTSLIQRSTVVLALSFALSAVLLFTAMLVLPLLPSAPPVLSVPAQCGIWLFICWHVAIAVGALAYAGFRRSGNVKPPSRRFSLAATAITLGLASAVIGAVFALGDRLPVLAEGVSLAGLTSTGVGPATVALLALAAIVVSRIREPTSLDGAFAFSLLAMALEIALLVLGGHRYSAIFYVGRVLVFAGALFVLVSAIGTLIAGRTLLREMESALSKAHSDAAKGAGRVRAVWHIASHAEEMSDEDRFGALLDIATAALRPGTLMFGSLCHLDAESIVIDVIRWTGVGSGPPPATPVRPGARFPRRSTLADLLSAEPGARAWDDLDPLVGRNSITGALGLRSFIGSRIVIGNVTHFVTFASASSMAGEPFAEDDIAYVDVVASLFAARLNEQRQFERMKYQVEHDALTGLENRVQFRMAVRDEIRRGGPFAIAFINLDGFRHVNEQRGHEFGDELLVQIANGLVAVAEDDLVARMGADEFGVLVRHAESAEQTVAAIEHYSELFSKPFQTGDSTGPQLIAVGASVGGARFPQDGHSPGELMRRADVALDVAKSRGGSTVMLFDVPMEVILEEARVRYVELANAIATDQLSLEYQPTFELATRKITGAEALVRWNHPQRGKLPPADFIDFAERNGLIGALSQWVFHRLARDIASIGVLPAAFRIYFNVAAQMLDDIPFITDFKNTLRASPYLASHVGVEVTETAAMQNVERSMNTIDLFRRWGVLVAIDDFGTGYSSLSYLKQLTVDMIKIDRSFVIGLPNDERDDAITEMLLRITDRFGFATLAEGIETEGQLTWLLEHGCRFGQGYLIARPEGFACLIERLGEIRVA